MLKFIIQSSFLFFSYLFASTRYSGKNYLFLQYFDNQIAPAFDDSAEYLKLFQIAPLTVSLPPKFSLYPLEEPETC